MSYAGAGELVPEGTGSHPPKSCLKKTLPSDAGAASTEEELQELRQNKELQVQIETARLKTQAAHAARTARKEAEKLAKAARVAKAIKTSVTTIVGAPPESHDGEESFEDFWAKTAPFVDARLESHVSHVPSPPLPNYAKLESFQEHMGELFEDEILPEGSPLLEIQSARIANCLFWSDVIVVILPLVLKRSDDYVALWRPTFAVWFSYAGKMSPEQEAAIKSAEDDYERRFDPN